MDTNEPHKLKPIAKQWSLETYTEVVDSLLEVVFEIDLEGNLVFYNKSALDFFGYNLEDLDRGFVQK